MRTQKLRAFDAQSVWSQSRAAGDGPLSNSMNQSVRFLSSFLAFGVPFLLGYGVLPLPNFTNELAALLGFGFLLLAFSQDGVGWKPASTYAWMGGAIGLLMALVVVQGIRWGVAGSAELYFVTLGYLGLAALAFHVGWHVGCEESLRMPWMLAMCRALAFAAVMAALAGLLQYFKLPGNWAVIPYLDTAGRAFGFIRQPNHQATFLVIGLQALAFLVARDRLPQIVLWVAGAVISAGVLATGSRLGFALLGLVLVWSALTLGPRLRRFAVFMLVLAPLAVLAMWWLSHHADLPFYAVAKLDQSLQEGAGVRTIVWAETIKLIATAPWFGLGVHRFGANFFLSDAASNSVIVMSHSHNLVLQLAADYGVPAAAIVCLVLARVLWSGRAAWRDNVGASAMGMVACIGLHSMVEFPLWYLYFLLPGMLMLGVIASTRESVQGSTHASQVDSGQTMPQPRRDRCINAGLSLCGAIILVLAVWMNHDFYKVSPIFRGVPASQVQTAIDDAQSVTWHRRFVRYADIAREPVTADNAAQYWSSMSEMACVMLEPLYQSSLVVSLAYQGRIDEAKRLLFIYWRLSRGATAHIKQKLSEHKGPAFDELQAFIDKPVPVNVPPGKILPCLN